MKLKLNKFVVFYYFAIDFEYLCISFGNE